MNMKYKTRMKIVSVLLTACFILLMGGVISKAGIVSMNQKDYEKSREHYHTVKTNREAFEKVLGDIYDRNGCPILLNNTPVIESSMDYDKSYSHLLGNVYLSDSGFINSNYTLLTNTRAKDVNPDKGYSVTVTLADELQKHCYSLTEGKRGSIVVLKRHSGELLACTSTYTEDFDLSGAIDDNRVAKYNKSSEPVWTAEYLNSYYSGSCQKAFTAAVAFETGLDDYVIEDVGFIDFNGAKIYNFDGEEFGTLGMTDAFIYSSNTYFASLFNQIKPEDIRNYSSKALLGSSVSTDFGNIDNRFNLSSDPFERGLLGMGQGNEVSSTGMALMLQAVIDNEVYRPHVFKSSCINTSDGTLETVEVKEEELLAKDIFSEETCEKVRDLMESAARSEGYLLSENILGAKSGTAEITLNGNPTNRASLMAYNEEYIVVVSIIEDYRFGIHNKDILESVFNLLTLTKSYGLE